MELNIADAFDAIAAEIPERDGIIFGERRLSWGEVAERTDAFALLLDDLGLGRNRSFAESSGWESTQDHVALYLHNGNEYLEAMLGATRRRALP